MYVVPFYILKANIGDSKVVLFNPQNRHKAVLESKYLDNLLSEMARDLVDEILIHDLINKELVIPSSADQVECAIEAVFRDEKAEQLHLNIQPTLQCNKACVYCYQLKERQESNSLNMSEDTIDSIIKWFNYLCDLKDYKVASITIMGGEATIVPDAVSRLGKEIHEAAKIRGMKSRIQLNTNGVSLTSKMIKRWKDEFDLASLAVSIDGNASLHNSRRPLRSGKGSYDRIVSNIRKVMSETDIEVQIAMTVDPYGVEDVPDIIDFIKNIKSIGISGKNFKGVAIGITAPWTAEQKGKIDHDAIIYKMRKINDCVEEQEIPIYNPLFSAGGTACMAFSPNSWTVESNGSIYSCEFLAGQRDFQLGDVHCIPNPDAVDDLMYPVKQDFGNEVRSGICQDCEYLLVCAFGCAAYGVFGVDEEESRDIDRSLYRPHCMKPVFEAIYPEALKKQLDVDILDIQ